MSSRCSWAAGIIIIIAWVSGRPASASSSSTRSKAAESELPVGDQRQAALEVGAEELGVQRRLAGAHPVEVAGERVDLAVVGEQAQRLGELPAREGVGGEARVDDRERALQLGVAQVGVEARELRRAQHPLVDERPRAEAGDRERRARPRARRSARATNRRRSNSSWSMHVGAGADQQLAELGGDVAGGLAAAGQVDRDLAPAERLLAGLDHRAARAAAAAPPTGSGRRRGSSWRRRRCRGRAAARG